MRILIAKIGMLICPVLLVLGGLYCALPRNPTSFLLGFSIKDKILKSTHDPKVVLVGDSNLAFGVDSHALSRALKMNVVNAGFHAGLGANYLLNMGDDRAQGRGNIIIISFAYPLYLSGSDYGGDATLCELIFEVPAAAKYLGAENIPALLSGLGRVCGNRLLRTVNGLPFEVNPIYNSKAFDAYGDVVSHLSLKACTNLPPRMPPPSALVRRHVRLSPVVESRLTRFFEHVEGKGGHVYIVPSPCRKMEYDADAPTIQEAYGLLKIKFPGKVLSFPEAFVFDNDCFFDTPYHLNNKGRDMRTGRLIDIIRDAENGIRRQQLRPEIL